MKLRSLCWLTMSLMIPTLAPLAHASPEPLDQQAKGLVGAGERDVDPATTLGALPQRARLAIKLSPQEVLRLNQLLTDYRENCDEQSNAFSGYLGFEKGELTSARLRNSLANLIASDREDQRLSIYDLSCARVKKLADLGYSLELRYCVRRLMPSAEQSYKRYATIELLDESVCLKPADSAPAAIANSSPTAYLDSSSADQDRLSTEMLGDADHELPASEIKRLTQALDRKKRGTSVRELQDRFGGARLRVLGAR